MDKIIRVPCISCRFLEHVSRAQNVLSSAVKKHDQKSPQSLITAEGSGSLSFISSLSCKLQALAVHVSSSSPRPVRVPLLITMASALLVLFVPWLGRIRRASARM